MWAPYSCVAPAPPEAHPFPLPRQGELGTRLTRRPAGAQPNKQGPARGMQQETVMSKPAKRHRDSLSWEVTPGKGSRWELARAAGGPEAGNTAAAGDRGERGCGQGEAGQAG